MKSTNNVGTQNIKVLTKYHDIPLPNNEFISTHTNKLIICSNNNRVGSNITSSHITLKARLTAGNKIYV